MRTNRNRHYTKLLSVAGLCLTLGNAQAAQPPRVMFVSKHDVQPVIIDLKGREIPATKGMIIEPGFTVKVPEGATLQIMTPEKSIVAVRPNSSIRLETIGDGSKPYVFKLGTGGIRVANSEKSPHKFEINTPNATLKFDKGDHETSYLAEGQLKDGRWGTFVRGTKDDVTLTTSDGEVKVSKNDVGYVPGSEKGAPRLLEKWDSSGKGTRDSVSYVAGSNDVGRTDVVDAAKSPGDQKQPTTGLTRTAGLDTQKLALAPLPLIDEISARNVTLPTIPGTARPPAPTTLRIVPIIDAVKAPILEKSVLEPIVEVQRTVTGDPILYVKESTYTTRLDTGTGETKTSLTSETTFIRQ